MGVSASGRQSWDPSTPLVIRLCDTSLASGSRHIMTLSKRLPQGARCREQGGSATKVCSRGLQSPVTNPTFAGRSQYGQRQMLYSGGAF